MTSAGMNPLDRFTYMAMFNIEDIAKGEYFVSKTSDLHVLITTIDGPKIDCFICVGTKVDSNDGVAHTLEHLVFTNSKRFNLRGILDRLANRCFAQGTNAWTSIDQTVYSISTASEEGLINILPVYLDHIMNPIIIDKTFKSEVYHRDSDGSETGVVFSEMQAKQNTEFSITYFETMRRLFPVESGYCFNSGGDLQDIRTLNVEKIQRFHDKYYRPDNMLIIIIGDVSKNKILEGIIKAEDEILFEFIKKEKIERPWRNVDCGVPQYGMYEVKYPSESLTTGTILFTLKGPRKENTLEYLALNVIASYLSFFDESPIKSKFILHDNFCSEIEYNIFRFKNLYLQFKAFDLKIEKMSQIILEFKEILNTIIKDGLNMEFLKKVIGFEYYYFINQFELNPHSYVCTKGIEYFLYGKNSFELLDLMEERSVHKNLFLNDESFWNDFFKKYFNPDELVIVVGTPESPQKGPSSPKTVQQFKKAVESIKQHHEKPLAPLSVEIMNRFPIPSVENVPFHKITTLCNFGSFNFDKFSLEGFQIFDVPLAIQLDSIKSNILQVTLCVCLGNLNKELVPLLFVFSMLPFEMPVLRKGVLLPPDEVKKQLDLIFFSRSSSISWNSGTYELGILPYYYFVSLKTDAFHYESAISWIKDLTFNYKLDLECLKNIIDKRLQTLKNVAAQGVGGAIGLSNVITFKKTSVNYCLSIFYQIKYLQNLQQLLIQNPEKVQELIFTLGNELGTNSNIQAHLMCDFEKLSRLCPNPHMQWQLNFSPYAKYSSHTPKTASNFNFDYVNTENFFQKIVASSPTDSSFLIQTIPSIRSYRDPDFPNLSVLLEFLSGFEGPLWKRIRGKGLAYSTTIFCEPSDGLIYLKISKSTDIVHAYKEFQLTLSHYLNNENELNQENIESAISGVAFEVINQESNACDAGIQNMIAQLKGISHDFHKYFLQKVASITATDIQSTAKKYFPKILNVKKSHLAICCNHSKLETIIDGFKQLDIQLEAYDPQSKQ